MTSLAHNPSKSVYRLSDPEPVRVADRISVIERHGTRPITSTTLVASTRNEARFDDNNNQNHKLTVIDVRRSKLES